jgi:hypothetical protein
LKDRSLTAFNLSFQLKDREHTCYGESSTTQITTLESEDVPAGVQNEERVIILEKLLLKAGPYVPHLKEQIRAAVRPQAGTDIAEVKSVIPARSRISSMY